MQSQKSQMGKFRNLFLKVETIKLYLQHYTNSFLDTYISRPPTNSSIKCPL